MSVQIQFQPGDLVKARGREWVVLPETRPNLLRLRPLSGSESDATLIYLPLEPEPPEPATFNLPESIRPGSQEAMLLLRDALRLKLRAGTGPFRSFGNIAVEPRTYQLVPLLMALKLDPIRLLIADDVGIGKTIEACLIAREMLDRGEISRLTVICPPHLCEQWQAELATKFNLNAEVVRTGTAARLERGLRADESIFEVYPFTVVSLDYIKSDRRRDDFLRACPEFVIVDEAHTCVQSNSNTRHQRYLLLKGLAEAKPARHMVFLTATPHSGDDVAFYNLLGLLNPRFSKLAELTDESARQALRAELAQHFVQRRRGDIAEWKDSAGFPARESAEATYRLTGEWGKLFEEIRQYARTLVSRAEGQSKLQQRMSWWAALALLRCVSSSPAAAALALKTRLKAVQGVSEEQQISELDQTAVNTVMDGSADDFLSLDESVPAGTIETLEDVSTIRKLIERAETLGGPNNDPKLAVLIEQVKKLIKNGFRPVIFCRYIATAHYVAEHLQAALPAGKCKVVAVTGELTSNQREERVEELQELEENITPVLVATDCLSEGINLQQLFNAVVHYDLSWNPNRHEQREGRVDRFGQSSEIVRTLMLYGEDNPVDGAVLKVILRKAEKIRKELGVTVPLPADNDKVIDAIMKAALLQSGDIDLEFRQLRFDFGGSETEIETVWKTAKDKMSQTVFAQRRLRPDEVLPEWRKAVEVLGTEEDVERFVRLAAQRLGAPLEPKGAYYRFPIHHFPDSIRERFEIMGIAKPPRIAFRHPVPAGAEYIHRSHPLVATLADFIAEQALEEQRPEIGARCGAIFTREVTKRTTIYLLRLRNQLVIETRGSDGRFTPTKSILSEELIGVAVQGAAEPQVLSEADALAMMSFEPGRNMEPAQQIQLIQAAINVIPSLESAFNHIAERRAEELLNDHRRIRDASEAKGVRYSVKPALPVDKIGVYVFMPIITF